MLNVKSILPASVRQAGDVPSEADEGKYTVASNNRWSRVVLNYQALASDSWCELSFQIDCHPDEEGRNVHDFAAIGIDFLTDDGSSIDFAYVPGLTRTQIDPHSCYISGPDHLERSGHAAQHVQARCTFLVPSPAKQILVSIRSWRNSHPFKISQPTLRQVEEFEAAFENSKGKASASGENGRRTPSSARRNWRTLGADPFWRSYGLVPGRRLIIRGQVASTRQDSDGALVRVVFRNADGEQLPLPYPETQTVPGVGAFLNIPAHKQARRFTLEIIPPPQAAAVDLGFQARREEASIELVSPLEVSLEDDLLLENISGDDLPDALSFMGRLAERIDLTAWNGAPDAAKRVLEQLIDRKALASPLAIHAHLKRVQRGDQTEADTNHVSFAPFPAWLLPQQPTWTEDPFQSPAWRLEFQSLSWLPRLAEGRDPTDLARAIDLALSWSRSNPWGDPADVISAHPMSMAARAETLLQLLCMGTGSKRKVPPEKLLSLLAEIVRHSFALAQIISQNIFSHSVSQLHAACALLALAKALPRIPLAFFWKTIALSHLQDGFDELIGLEGLSIEQSQHYRLEIISLGLILAKVLEGMPEAQDLRQHLTLRLHAAARAIIAITDPSGMLPPFGDLLRGYHHASWLRRLISGYGQTLLSDKSIAAELSYPHGPRLFASPHAGVIAARYYEQKPDWGYLAASFNEQRHEHGHFDCTSFVYAAGGVRWIADPGGSNLYDVGPVRQYLVSSRAHNVAIPDGREQMAGQGWINSQTMLEGAYIFEIGTNVYGLDYVHRRIIACLGDLSAMAIFDRFSTSQRSISVDGYLHFEPEVTAAIVNPKLIVGFQGKSRLRIIPRVTSGKFGGVTIENGRNDSPFTLQGFVSGSPGRLEPASVLRYTFSGLDDVCGGAVLAVNEHGLRVMTRILDLPAVRKLLGQSPS